MDDTKDNILEPAFEAVFVKAECESDVEVKREDDPLSTPEGQESFYFVVQQLGGINRPNRLAHFFYSTYCKGSGELS